MWCSADGSTMGRFTYGGGTLVMSVDHDIVSPAGLVGSLYAKLAGGDVPGLLAALDSDIRWTVPAGLHYAGTYRGRNAVMDNVFARFGTDWDDFEVDPDEILESGDTVVALGHYRGRNKATGRAMEARFAHVWRIVDGVPAVFETIPDTHAMVRAGS
jgi:uncharacterized protein